MIDTNAAPSADALQRAKELAEFAYDESACNLPKTAQDRLAQLIAVALTDTQASARAEQDAELARLRKIEQAAIVLRSRCIVNGVGNPKMKEGFHVEVITDPEAWIKFWETLPIGEKDVRLAFLPVEREIK